jgi:hypothetical protein
MPKDSQKLEFPPRHTWKAEIQWVVVRLNEDGTESVVALEKSEQDARKTAQEADKLELMGK